MGLFFYRFCCLGSNDRAMDVRSEQQRKVKGKTTHTQICALLGYYAAYSVIPE